jgi:hypothetical protein
METYYIDNRVRASDGTVWKAALSSYILPDTTVVINSNIDPITQTGFFLPYGSVVSPSSFLQPNPTKKNFWWVKVSATATTDYPEEINEYKLLYTPIYHKTEMADQIVVSARPRYQCNAVAAFGLEAEEVEVSFGSYDEIRLTTVSGGVYVPQEVFMWSPAYSPAGGVPINITISNPGKTAKCGYLCFGYANRLGMGTYTTALSLTDMSHVERNATFGTIDYIIPREYYQRVDFKSWVPTRNIGQLKRLMGQVKSQPAAYFAHPDMRESLILGFYDTFNVAIDSYTDSEISLTVEGLV